MTFLFLLFIRARSEENVFQNGLFEDFIHISEETNVEIEGEFNNEKRTNFSYRSKVVITNSMFNSSFAFGSSMEFGSGGAIYATMCDVHISNTSYSNCVSMIGGAVSVVSSFLTTTGSQFIKCSAYHLAGALFFSSYNSGEHVYVSAYIYNTSFLQCKSHGQSGAIHFSNCSEAILINCYAKNCSSFGSSGAISFVQSVAFLDSCEFMYNTRDPYLGRINNQNQSLVLNRKGAGAITVTHLFETSETRMVTMNCSFNCNQVNHIYLQNEIFYHDIAFNGNSSLVWQSYSDSFQLKKNMSIGGLDSITYLLEGTHFYDQNLCFDAPNQISLSPVSEISEEVLPTDTQELDPTPMNTIVYQDQTPNPSFNFTYFATRNIPTVIIPTRISVGPTISNTLSNTQIETPFVTPEYTPEFTPEYTPIITPEYTPAITPEITLDQTLLETPFSSPEITLDQTLLETPASTPETTLDQTPKKSPVSTPETTPESSAEIPRTPIISPEATLDYTIPETPLETPVSTQETTLDQTLLETPEYTPIITPEYTPIITPEYTPIITPEYTPIITPEYTPIITPEYTPIITPEYTPIITPEYTPIITPEYTPIITPEYTPEFTPINTQEFTPESTFDRTLDITPIITLPYTPGVSPKSTPFYTPFNTRHPTIQRTPSLSAKQGESLITLTSVSFEESLVYKGTITTNTQITTLSESQVLTNSIVQQSTISNGTHIIVDVITELYSKVDVAVNTIIYMIPIYETTLIPRIFVQYSYLEESGSNGDLSAGSLIGLVTGAGLMLILIGALGVYFYRQSKDDSSGETSEESMSDRSDNLTVTTATDNTQQMTFTQTLTEIHDADDQWIMGDDFSGKLF